MTETQLLTNPALIRELNMDFGQRVVVETARQDWMTSPSSNVWRKPLEREAAGHGHTTSIVRFEAGSSFPRHEHPLGEEILVLDGVFSDEHGDYGPGTYIRNPPGSTHSPFSREGCELFVKLDVAGDINQQRPRATQGTERKCPRTSRESASTRCRYSGPTPGLSRGCCVGWARA